MRIFRTLALIVALTFPMVGAISCTGNRAPILVAQSGIALADAISTLSTAAAQLEKGNVLPTQTALSAQQSLKRLNTQMRPLVDLLKTIDSAQQAADPALSDVDRAIEIVKVVSSDLSTVLTGVPIGEAASSLIKLVQTTQNTVSIVLVELGRLKQEAQ